MKIICGNVQGAKESQLRHEVGFINRTIKPDILILLETLVNCQNIDFIIKQLGYSYYSAVPPVNHTGGIWLLWNDENVDVSIIAKETRIMHCLVLDKLTAKECLLSAVYALAREVKKMIFGSILNRFIILLINRGVLWVTLMKCSMHQKNWRHSVESN